MSSNVDSLAGRVRSSFLQLSAAASDLNTISDELGQCVSEIDAALKKLNVGITAWVDISSNEDDDLQYYRERIGYAKVEGKWGIALCTVSGSHDCPDEDRVDIWLFNEAPRQLRLEAINKLPNLLQKLSEEAAKTTAEIMSGLSEALLVADAVKQAASEPPVQVKPLKKGEAKK